MAPRLPQPGADQGNWGQILNEYLSVEHNPDGTLNQSGTIALKYTKPQDGIPSSDFHQTIQDQLTKVDQHNADIASIKGRSIPLLYHSFADKPDGSPNGQPVDSGGVNWSTTGTVPPTVTSGRLNGAGSGYLWTTLPATPIMVEIEVSFGGTVPSNSSLTISICKTGGASLINDIAHLICGPSGALLQLNKDATGGFDFILGAEWSSIPLNGTKARIGLEIVGDRATILGPDGSTWSTLDRRISSTLGTNYRTFFVQAGSAAGAEAYIHTVGVFGRAATGLVGLSDRNKISPASVRNNPSRLVGAPNKTAQVSIGGGNGATASFPTVGFGTIPTGQDGLRATLLANTSLSATTIQLDQAIYGYSTLTIGYGNDAETVTVSSVSGASPPFTITTAPLSKAHAAGEPVTGVTPRYKEIYLDMSNGLLMIPGSSTINGTLEFGTARDTTLVRTAAGTLSLATAGALRTGRNTTANRPSAATVGNAAMFYDTTLNKPIWSDGTNWRDASGTIV